MRTMEFVQRPERCRGPSGRSLKQDLPRVSNRRSLPSKNCSVFRAGQVVRFALNPATPRVPIRMLTPHRERLRPPAGRGMIIAFEGIDACGKTTQIRALESWLAACEVPSRTFSPYKGVGLA